MSDQVVNIKLVLNAEGIKKAEDDLKRLNKLKQQAETMGGSAGAKSAAFQGSQYATARGTIGTGAEGRDFAKQSQGLGGLVRLYATVAANLFAVTAAFNALKDAMATTNMIEGLNQLGAQSGQSLGTLAKNFAAASGGAISLRDAMQATVQATSAGLSAKQLSQIGEVAKKASLALGRDMPDSVSRLTRGITKLEPELLDELGIFTKVGKATEDYANSVGKSVMALTDFEKRQAYANAVLKEGLDKFSAIDIDANPYDKLLASLKNIAQAGLETVNFALGPLVNLLSSSPQALTVGIAALSAVLLKQAIPAIGQYRQGLSDSAETAKKASAIRATEAKRAAEEAAITREAPLDKAAEKALAAKEAAADAVLKSRTSGFSKASEAARILKKDVLAVNEADLAYLTKKGESYQKQGKQNVADRYYGAVKAIEESAKAERAYGDAVEANNKKLGARYDTASGRAQIIAKRAADVATSKSIVSEAAERTSIVGMGSAWTDMRKNIKESDMGPIRKGFTTISGAASIASTAIMGLVGALQGWIFIITAVVAGIKMFDAWMTKNAEQSEAFTRAIESSNEAVKNYDRTIKAMSKMGGSAVFSSVGITAQANAFNTLTDSLGTLREKFEELTKATEGWDKFWDGVFSKGQAEKFAEASVASISKIITAIRDPAVAASVTKEVSAVLGTKGSSQLEWITALKKSGPEAAAAVKRIEDRVKPLGKELNVTANSSKDFNDQLKKLGESYKAFAFSTIDKSPMSVLGDDLLEFSVKTIDALKDTETGLASMSKLLQDNAKLGMFSTETFAQLQKMKSEVESLNKTHGETTIKLNDAKQAVASLELEYEKAEKQRVSRRSRVGLVMGVMGLDTDPKKVKGKLDAANEAREQLQKQSAEEIEKIDKVMANPAFKNLAVEAFKIGTDLITKSLDEAFKKGSIEIRRASISGLMDLPGSGGIVRDIDKDDLEIQKSQLELMSQMVKAQYLNIAAVQKAKAGVELETAQSALATAQTGSAGPLPGTDPKVIAVALAENMLKISERFNTYVQTGATGAGGAKDMVEEILKSMNDFGREGKDAPLILKAMVEYIKQMSSIEVAKAGVAAKDTVSDLQSTLNIIKEQKGIKDRELSVEESILATQRAGVTVMGQQNAFQTQAQVGAQAQLASQTAILEFKRKSNAIDAEQKARAANIESLRVEAQNSNSLTTEKVKKYNALEAEDKAIIDQARAIALRDKNNKLAEAGGAASASLIKLLAEEEERRLNIQKIIAETNTIRDTTTNELNELELQYKITLGTLSEQEIADAKNRIEARKIETEATSKLATLELSYLSARNKLMAESKAAAPGEAGEAIRKNAEETMQANDKKYAAEVAGVKSVTAAKLKQNELDASISERQKAYEDIFKKTFEGMGNAIVEFVKTGKLEFSSLISSMLEDLVRYELKQQSMALYNAAKTSVNDAGGFAGLLGKVFGGANPTDTGGVSEFGGAAVAAVAAKGASFDYGIEKYAKGGAFSNQIVDSPTLFKFAKGTGMMGEAGPEAIMPLKRDAQGNLGVRSGQQQSKVDVVVNNYGNEQATTTETTDSRGNRKIEVTIGDMTAGEVSRSGSASQRSLRSTYGLQPQLIRR